MEYGKDLDTERSNRTPFGFQADRIHRRVMIGDGKQRAGETLNIPFKKIKNEVIVPGSVYVSFNAKPMSSTDKSTYFVPNLGRAIVQEKELYFNGEKAIDVVRCSDFYLYKDLWLRKKERDERILQGIQDELGLKYRIDAKKTPAGGELDNVTEGHKALKKAYGNTFIIPLDDELFKDNGPLFPGGLMNEMAVELKLASASQVLISTDKSATYELTSIHLEWDAIIDPSLSTEVANSYREGRGVLYDRVLAWKEMSVSKNTPIITLDIRCDDQR